MAFTGVAAAQSSPDYRQLVGVVTKIVTSPDFFESTGLHLQAELADLPNVEREKSCAPDLTVLNPSPDAPVPYLLSVAVDTPNCQTVAYLRSLNMVIPGVHPEFVAAIKPRLEAAYGPVAEMVDHGEAVIYRWHPGKDENLSLLVDQGTASRPALLSLLAVRLPPDE